MRWVQRCAGAPLHWRLFMFLGITILVALLAATAAAFLVHPQDSSPMAQWNRAAGFVGDRFAHVWEDQGERRLLARTLADRFDANVTVLDPNGRVLEEFGADGAAPGEKPSCSHGHELDVKRAGGVVGRVQLCRGGFQHGWASFLLFLGTAGTVLWMAAGLFARKIGRPLGELTAVTREIGSGHLKSRARLATQVAGEIGELASAVNQMAGRIERQIGEHKELLAAVSHEIRSPLARLRVLSELMRDSRDPAAHLDEVEREIFDLDTLTGKLLAKSRLDFDTLDRAPLDPVELARNQLRRSNLDQDLLKVEGDVGRLHGDSTLLSRALENVFDNARHHGGAVTRVTVRAIPHGVVFEVCDRGPGFAEEEAERLFAPFERGNGEGGTHRTGLGLGLSLVRQIAVAHGGTAHAKNLPGGGACLSIEIKDTPPD